MVAEGKGLGAGILTVGCATEKELEERIRRLKWDLIKEDDDVLI